ncbi:hypothetical protein VFPPC_13562 [Pochonia chlamydosporia 170]|uniref:LysM domain-containing protein n=1 Tax=Pochonia chlamydosporia 170 TaxID=1380566 RepID=A0A179FQZ5_METCM|nr:hypothetical protein VFPPC_13562 [Pochonia chlamydosporia 170]OAQ67678.1 hypothetical protein VFPPC_13562 [Pochonia chlamydosporia 170]
MMGLAKTLIFASQLTAVVVATPTINNDNELTTKWPVCVKPTKVLDERTPTVKRGPVETPLPTQPGMVNNCNKFCWVQTGNKCFQVAMENHISLADFLKWNPGAGSDCRTLWANTYACVGVSKK